MTHFGDLGDGIDPLTVPDHRHQIGRAGQIRIPEIMVNRLKMPDSFSGGGIESYDRIREKVLPFSIGPVMVVGG